MARTPKDPGLELIADLERRIVAGHDERAQLGASVEDVARERPAVVLLAATIAERLRAEHLRRQGRV